MRLGLGAARQARFASAPATGGECVLGDDEGAVGREVDRPLAAGLEPVTPPERIARVVDPVRAGEPDVDLLVGSPIAASAISSPGSRPSASAAGAGSAASTTPAPPEEGQSPATSVACSSRSVVEAEHGQRIGRAAAALGNARRSPTIPLR